MFFWLNQENDKTFAFHCQDYKVMTEPTSEVISFGGIESVISPQFYIFIFMIFKVIILIVFLLYTEADKFLVVTRIITFNDLVFILFPYRFQRNPTRKRK